MDNAKDDKYYIELVVTDVEFMIEHTKDKTKSEIASNPLLIDSIMFRLIQIAENCAKLSQEYKDKNNEIPWKAIKGMRNRIVHDYGVVNIERVYDTVVNSIPQFYKQIKQGSSLDDILDKMRAKFKAEREPDLTEYTEESAKHKSNTNANDDDENGRG